mgnify:CR=1 FL=1|jgi:glycosyltransferase involved in cell wall biosynthesis
MKEQEGDTMKVLILSSKASSLMQFRADLIIDLVANGHEVIAAAPEEECNWKDRVAAWGAKYSSFYLERTGLNPISDLRGLGSILKLIKKEKPDIVFTYQAKTIIYGCTAAWLCGVPSINALLAGLGSAFRSKDRKLLKRILCLQYKFALARCRNVFFQNRDDLGEFLKAGIVSENKVTMINGSGVNLENFTPQPIPDDDVFLFVGRLIRDKGLIEYMEAARKVKSSYPTAQVKILGSFDTNPTAVEPSDLDPYIKDGSIEYLGETDDVRPYLKKCSVFVLPSYHEGTPKSALEAMATERPIITTDAPGCRETVIEGTNGFLVPAGDVDALAEKMIWMIEHKDEAARMAKASLEICREKFDVKKVNAVLLKTMGL